MNGITKKWVNKKTKKHFFSRVEFSWAMYMWMTRSPVVVFADTASFVLFWAALPGPAPGVFRLCSDLNGTVNSERSTNVHFDW